MRGWEEHSYVIRLFDTVDQSSVTTWSMAFIPQAKSQPQGTSLPLHTGAHTHASAGICTHTSMYPVSTSSQTLMYAEGTHNQPCSNAFRCWFIAGQMGTFVHTAEENMHERAAHVSSCGDALTQKQLSSDASVCLFCCLFVLIRILNCSFLNFGSHEHVRTVPQSHMRDSHVHTQTLTH